jgi:hypothetical protein
MGRPSKDALDWLLVARAGSMAGAALELFRRYMLRIAERDWTQNVWGG